MMENNQLMDDYETSFLYEWQTAEEDLEFLDYTYCFEVETPNKRTLNASSKQTKAVISITDNTKIHDEKQTILKISLEKLRHIEDPESSLRRSVLINNTLKCIRSGLRMNEDSSASCFAYSLPCKRMRLNSELTPNCGTTIDKNDPSAAITRQDGLNGVKEVGNDLVSNDPIDKMSLCASEVSSLTRQSTKESKRNCDIVRFAELDFSNVICALET